MISTRTARTLSIAAFAAAFAGVSAAQAQETDKDKATIIVAGEGRATTAPDMAVLQLSVVKDGKTAREALDANNKTMAEVLKALKDGGIADRDLQTSGFMLNPQYTYPTNTDGSNRAPELIGYQVTNGVSVRVRDLAKLGEVIDKSVSLGVNQGGGVQFTNDKPEAVITEARKAAVADAVEKAKVLAEAAGVSVGKIVNISEQGFRPEPVPMMRAGMAKEYAADSVPVATGENSYNVTVNVTFEIKQ